MTAAMADGVALVPVSNARRAAWCAWTHCLGEPGFPDSAVLRWHFPVPCPGDFHGA